MITMTKKGKKKKILKRRKNKGTRKVGILSKSFDSKWLTMFQ